MEKKDYLEKYEDGKYEFDDIVDRLVTWSGFKVEILRYLSTNSGKNNILAIVDMDGFDRVVTYSLDGIAIGESDRGLDLYIDMSYLYYLNVNFVNGKMKPSEKLYKSMKEAKSHRSRWWVDTVPIRVKVADNK